MFHFNEDILGFYFKRSMKEVMWSYVRARLWEHKTCIKEYKRFAMAGENEDYFSGRAENVDVMGVQVGVRPLALTGRECRGR